MKILLPVMYCLTAAISLFAAAPAVYGPAPSARQLVWHETEILSLIHFGMNTINNVEWGFGDSSPEKFNPKKFNADQIVSALKAGGIRQVMFVAKHHDGFCLWPTKTTDYAISKSPYRGGRGDLVREFADAAKKRGLRFGVYCSPWDRNSAKYGTDRYLPMYHAQLTELLSNYGTISEMWFDGANGGDGYYGGAKEKRNINRSTYYDWPNTWALVRKLQPMACIFGDVGPDCRWVGNEDGYAAEDCWAAFTPIGKTIPDKPGNGDLANQKEATTGLRDGKFWIPPECDVPLRKGWFWHPDQDSTVRSPATLMDIYFKSVGKGGCMDLGVAPTADGIVCEADRIALEGFGTALRLLFKENLAEGATASADAVRKAGPQEKGAYAPALVLDGDRYSYWATEDGVTQATLTLQLAATKEFDVIRLRENIKLGQRVDGWTIEISEGKEWKTYATGKSIGACRLVRGRKVTADRVRLRITAASACPCISDFGIFAMPASL